MESIVDVRAGDRVGVAIRGRDGRAMRVRSPVASHRNGVIDRRREGPLNQPVSPLLEQWMLAAMPRLRILSRRLAVNTSDAEDLVQATCLRALEKSRFFVSGSATEFGKWLLTIMYHLKYDTFRRGRRELLRENLDYLPDDTDRECSAGWRTIEDDLVADAVRGLPGRLQTPYVLLAEEHLTYSAIADRLNIPVRTVGTRIFRARARLRETLREHAPLEPAA